MGGAPRSCRCLVPRADVVPGLLDLLWGAGAFLCHLDLPSSGPPRLDGELVPRSQEETVLFCHVYGRCLDDKDIP